MIKNKTTFNIIVIIIICAICYHKNINAKFVFDDTEAIINNIDLDSKTALSNILKNDFWGTNINSNSSHKSYRPVTVLVYRSLVAAAGSKEPLWFHTFNLLLYISVCITWYIYLKIFYDYVAFPSTILFTVHPVHTEVVSSAVGCADLLCTLFFCFALINYHYSVLYDSLLNYLSALVLTSVATFCKEIGITALGVFFLLDILLSTKNNKQVPNRFWFLRLIGSFLTGLLLLYIRCKVMNFTQPTFQVMDNPASFAESLLTRFLTYNYIYTLNGIILLWPQWLCFDWSMGCIPLIENILDVRILFVTLFWVTGIIFVYKVIVNRDKIICFSITMIVIPFLPASNILFRVGFVIAERVLFLPSAGVCLLVTYGWLKLYNKLKTYKQTVMIAYWLLIILFAIKSYERASQWVDERSLFTSALDVCPNNAKVHYNVAKVAGDIDQLDYAESEYRLALKLHPNYDQAMNNLANLLRDRGKLHEAKNLLNKAVSLRPDFAAAWMNLGIVLATLGEDDQAETCYKKALMHRRNYSDCYYNLGNLFLKRRQQNEALKMWSHAIEINPSHSAAWSNMLVLLDTIGQYEKVIEQGAIALKFCPKSPAIYFTIANTLGKLKKWPEAEYHFKNAINLNPQNALYYSNFAAWSNMLVLLDTIGQYEKVIEQGAIALKFCPKSPAIYFTIANTLGKLKKWPEAEYHFKNAINLNPQNALYYSNFGVLYHRWGDLQKAKQMYEKALVINPHMQTTIKNLNKINKLSNT